jgi:hypothetical protein
MRSFAKIAAAFRKSERSCRNDRPHYAILIGAIILVVFWQLTFLWNKDNLNAEFRLRASSALRYNYVSFVYFYYYLDIFPLTSTLFLNDKAIPEEYLSKEAAEEIMSIPILCAWIICIAFELAIWERSGCSCLRQS